MKRLDINCTHAVPAAPAPSPFGQMVEPDAEDNRALQAVVKARSRPAAPAPEAMREADDECAACGLPRSRHRANEFGAVEVGVGTHAFRQRVTTPEQDGVPGQWVCDRCGYGESRAILSARDGYGRVQPFAVDPRCPNDGEPLRPLSWKEAAHSAREAVHDLVERLTDAESGRAALSREIETLRADKARLDWFEWEHPRVGMGEQGESRLLSRSCTGELLASAPTFREAIDVARAARVARAPEPAP